MSGKLDCHALVIGINTYGGRVAQLRSAVPDAVVIAKLLAETHSYTVECLLDVAATRTGIERALAALPLRLSQQSAFLLYFAGHGVAHGDGRDEPRGYLLPQDAQFSNEETWISMTALLGALEALPCRHLLVVLDCCSRVHFVGHPLEMPQWATGLSLTVNWHATWRERRGRH